jgi:hypothetical protein
VEQPRLSISRERRFPLLDPGSYVVTSAETDTYNCVGWAADVTDPGQWWPLPDAPEYFWPECARRDETLEAFAEGFATLGYETCADGDYESDFEKIVVYAARGVPTHVARQLPSGRWTSKLGAWEDIEHADLRALSGSMYGYPELFMRRRIAGR